MSVSLRKPDYRNFRKVVSNTEENCNFKVPNLKLVKKLKNQGADGQVYLAEVNKVQVVVKRQHFKKNLLIETSPERILGQIVTQFVFAKICPNFPLTLITNTCKENNNINSGGLSEIYLELEEGDIKTHLLTNSSIVNSCFAQIIFGLVAFDQVLGAVHQDLHLGNVFERKVPYIENTAWKYNINGKSYYIKNNGIQYLVSDFGRSCIPYRFNNHWCHGKFNFEKNETDIERVRRNLKKEIQYTFKKKYDILEKRVTLGTHISKYPELYKDYLQNKNYKIIETYTINNDSKSVIKDFIPSKFNKYIAT